MLTLRVITPKRVVLEEEILSITAPGGAGELTVLPNHAPLFTTLDEGIVRVETRHGEEFLSIGGGYLETDGETLHLLVSRAYGQDEIDEAAVQKAKKDAEALLENAAGEQERHQIMQELRRSTLDLKLLQKVKRKRSSRIRTSH